MTVPGRHDRDRTRLTDHLAGFQGRFPAGSVFVCAEDPLICARLADRACRLDVPQRKRALAVGVSARDLVHRQAAGVAENGHAAERAAPQRRSCRDSLRMRSDCWRRNCPGQDRHARHRTRGLLLPQGNQQYYVGHLQTSLGCRGRVGLVLSSVDLTRVIRRDQALVDR